MTAKAYNLAFFVLLFSTTLFSNNRFETDGSIRIPYSAIRNCPCEDGREFTKTSTREFDQLPNGTTALYNKYGKVDVKTWNQNRVKIDVTIIVVADNQAEADKALARLNVNYSNSNGYVKAETMIDESSKGGSWWGAFTNWTGSSCQDFKINYDVYLPIANQVDLKNKYGDSFLAALEGKLTADIKYGDLRSEGLKNDVSMSLGYGKATFANAVNVSGSISYGEMTVGECRDISLNTKYSEMNFTRANDLDLRSQYDEMTIGAVNNLKVNTNYSDLKIKSAHQVSVDAGYSDVLIGWLGSRGDFDMNYGGLKIESLDNDFQQLDLEGSYTDFTVMLEKGTGFRFDATGQYADIKYPMGMNVSRFEESGSRKTVSGTHGDGKASINVKLNYGGIYLK